MRHTCHNKGERPHALSTVALVILGHTPLPVGATATRDRQNPAPVTNRAREASRRDGRTGEAHVSLTSTDPVVTHAIEDMLRLTTLVKDERDPIAALRDLLLDMRAEVTE